MTLIAWLKKSSFILCVLLGMMQPVFAQWIPSKGPYGGKITALAISGSAIFAGTWGGGIYLSENNGESWTPMNSGLPDKALIVSLAVKDSRVFASLSSVPGSSSIYVSNNSGGTWTLFSTGLPSNPYVYALTILENNIIAGTNKGVLASENSGASWKAVNEGLPANAYVYALAVSGTRLFAGTWSNGIFVSEDNGAFWSQSSNGLPLNCRVYSIAANGKTIYAGTNSGVYISENKGERWTPSNGGLSTVFVSSLAIGETRVYAGSNQVYATPLAKAAALPNIPEETVTVVPNPCNGSFVLGSKVPDTQTSEIFITNAEGMELFRSTEKIGEGLKIDLPNAARGVYLLHIQNAGGATIKKVVVQ
jgi:hypothetical protein